MILHLSHPIPVLNKSGSILVLQKASVVNLLVFWVTRAQHKATLSPMIFLLLWKVSSTSSYMLLLASVKNTL